MRKMIVVCLLLLAIPLSALAQAPAEAVVVHGHWVLEVRNPDGTITERRDFQNALLPSGASWLGRVISRLWTPGFWRIDFISVVPTRPAWREMSDSESNSGGIYEEMEPLLGSLTLSGGDTLILTGTKTANLTGQITHVRTGNSRCSPDIPPDQCKRGGLHSQFAQTEIKKDGVPTPLSLVAGQILQVTVTISFSTS